MSQRVTVYKLDEAGNEVWRYDGRILSRRPEQWTLEAEFRRETTRLGDLTIVAGDRFVETFYADRWYNVFEIHDGHTDELKGWYCNLARPARLEGNAIIQEDLALDLVVYPDGRLEIFDQQEYDGLVLSADERKHVEAGLEELKALAGAGQGPFRQSG
jgi:protein associated with RNAse G/E